MIEVALESSCRRASVALRTEDRIVEVQLDEIPIDAGGVLCVLEEMVNTAGIEPSRIDAVYVGTGPGSYTGLRIGIATALGLARGTGAACRGEPSGETIAWRELAPGEECVHLLDARQSELYFAHYRRGENEVEVLHPPTVLRPDQLASRMPPKALIHGDTHVFAKMEDFGITGLDPPKADRMRPDTIPHAGALLELASRRLASSGAHSLAEVEPLYLRPFKARIRKRN